MSDQRLMADHGFTRSMSRSGNVAMESFFSSLKTDRIARRTYHTRDQARADVFDDIACFNNPARRHSMLCDISPIKVTKQSRSA